VRAGLVISLALWALIFAIAGVARAEPNLPAGNCDALTFAGYADGDGRVEFVIPFQGEPACECAPGPCGVKASSTDAVIVRPFGTPKTSGRPARIVCWGRR
jgi:hypothetical protein